MTRLFAVLLHHSIQHLLLYCDMNSIVQHISPLLVLSWNNSSNAESPIAQYNQMRTVSLSCSCRLPYKWLGADLVSQSSGCRAESQPNIRSNHVFMLTLLKVFSDSDASSGTPCPPLLPTTFITPQNSSKERPATFRQSL